MQRNRRQVLVLHTSPTAFAPPWTEGLKNNIFAWAKKLQHYDFDIITTEDFSVPNNIHLHTIDLPVKTIWQKLAFTWKMSRKAKQLYTQHSYDTVFFNINSYNIFIPLLFLKDVPKAKKVLFLGSERFITSLEEFKINLGQPPLFLKKALFGQFGGVITVSRKLKNQLIREKLASERHILHLPALSLEQLSSPSAAFKGGRQKENEFTILYLGNFHATRGIFVLLKAFSLFLRQSKKAKLLLCWNRIGNRSLVEDYLKKEKLYKNVEIRTEVKLEDVFQEASCFVLPMLSQRNVLEYPLSILESLYYGVPVITTPLESFKELIHKGENGNFFAGDAQSLSKALIQQSATTITPSFRKKLQNSIMNLYSAKEEQLESFLRSL